MLNASSSCNHSPTSRSLAIRTLLSGGAAFCFHRVLNPLVGNTYSRLIGLGIFFFTMAVSPAAKE